MTSASTDLQFSGLTRRLIEKNLLTESDAQTYSKEAQKKHKRGDDGRLAVLYGISRETISSIRLGKTWKEV